MMRYIAIETARRLEPPLKVYEPLLRVLQDCPEEDLQSWITKMFDACRSSKWGKIAKEIEGLQDPPRKRDPMTTEPETGQQEQVDRFLDRMPPEFFAELSRRAEVAKTHPGLSIDECRKLARIRQKEIREKLGIPEPSSEADDT